MGRTLLVHVWFLKESAFRFLQALSRLLQTLMLRYSAAFLLLLPDAPHPFTAPASEPHSPAPFHPPPLASLSRTPPAYIFFRFLLIFSVNLKVWIPPIGAIPPPPRPTLCTRAIYLHNVLPATWLAPSPPPPSPPLRCVCSFGREPLVLWGKIGERKRRRQCHNGSS